MTDNSFRVISNTFGLSNNAFLRERVVVTAWYMKFIRNDSPVPAFPLMNRNGNVLIHDLAQPRPLLKTHFCCSFNNLITVLRLLSSIKVREERNFDKVGSLFNKTESIVGSSSLKI